MKLIKNSNEKISIMLEIVMRIGFVIKRIYDNFYVFSAASLIKFEKTNLFQIYACQGWILGLISGIVRNIYEIIIAIGRKDTKNLIINLVDMIGKVGDLIPASNGAMVAEQIFGIVPNDLIIGIGGTISAFSNMFILWENYCS